MNFQNILLKNFVVVTKDIIALLQSWVQCVLFLKKDCYGLIFFDNFN